MVKKAIRPSLVGGCAANAVGYYFALSTAHRIDAQNHNNTTDNTEEPGAKNDPIFPESHSN